MEKSQRKQLKEDVKDIKPIVGLVSVKNKLNHKVYIEGSINARALINKIKFTLNSGKFENSKLQDAWNELGGESFLFEIISEIKFDEANILSHRKEVIKLKDLALANFKQSGISCYNGVDI